MMPGYTIVIIYHRSGGNGRMPTSFGLSEYLKSRSTTRDCWGEKGVFSGAFRTTAGMQRRFKAKLLRNLTIQSSLPNGRPRCALERKSSNSDSRSDSFTKLIHALDLGSLGSRLSYCVIYPLASPRQDQYGPTERAPPFCRVVEIRSTSEDFGSTDCQRCLVLRGQSGDR